MKENSHLNAGSTYGYEEQQHFIETGRMLHNQAVRGIFFHLFEAAARPLRKLFGVPAVKPDVNIFSGGIAVKK